MTEKIYIIKKLRELAKSLGYEIRLRDCLNIAETILSRVKVGTGIIDHNIAVEHFQDR